MKTQKRITIAGILATFTIALVVLTSCEQPTDSPAPTGGDITYTVAQTGGTDGTTNSTGIVFTFSASVDSLNLTAADITVGGTAAKGTTALSGTGTTRTLAITVSAAGSATVKITKTGIEAETKNVTVYKAGQTGPTGITYTAVQTGGVATTTDSTGIIFTFSASVDSLGLTAADITISGAAVKGTTALSGTGTTRTLAITVSAAGTATVTITKTGIETGTKNVTVYKAGQTGPTGITYTAVQTGGTANMANTTGIVFTFSASVDNLGLTAADITVSGAALKGSATLSGSGTTRTLLPITVNSAGTANITITKTGIEAGTKNVTVFKAGPDDITYTVTEIGGTANTADSIGLMFTFSESVDSLGLTVADITVSGVASKGSATLSGAGTTRTLSTITVSSAGTANVTISKSGIEAGTKNITVFKALGLAYELINSGTAYRVRKGTVTSGAVVIPATYNGLPVKEIGNASDTINTGAFAGTEITSVTIPSSVTSIGAHAFNGCTTLTSVNIPTGVTSIGNNAFCLTGLTSVNIPASVTSIGSNVFFICSNLITIIVDAGNPNYTSNGGILYNKAQTAILAVPVKISGSVSLPNGLTSINSVTFVGCTGLTSISIPSSVTSIGETAFMNTGLTSINIPASVTTIGNIPFYNNANLTTITVDAGNPNYSSEGGILYNKTKTTLIQALQAGISGNFTIPSSVTSLGYGAFSSCTNLTAITIPASVTSIGQYVFEGCTDLTSITFATGSVISNTNFSASAFPVNGNNSNLNTAYLAGGAGTYTRAVNGETWTKQP